MICLLIKWACICFIFDFKRVSDLSNDSHCKDIMVALQEAIKVHMPIITKQALRYNRQQHGFQVWQNPLVF